MVQQLCRRTLFPGRFVSGFHFERFSCEQLCMFYDAYVRRKAICKSTCIQIQLQTLSYCWSYLPHTSHHEPPRHDPRIEGHSRLPLRNCNWRTLEAHFGSEMEQMVSKASSNERSLTFGDQFYLAIAYCSSQRVVLRGERREVFCSEVDHPS